MPLRPLRRAALVMGLALAAGAAGQAAADCGGPSLLDRLDPPARLALAGRVAATPHAEGLLWSARRGGARVLLVGTLHLPDPRHRATLLDLAPALRDADLVLLETTPAEEAAMARAVALHPDLALSPVDLADRLPPAAWTTVAAAAQARGLDPMAAGRIRPWLLTLALGAPPCAADLPGRDGLDRMLMRAALAEGVPVGALEPWDTLFRIFEGGDGSDAELEMLRGGLLDDGTSEALLVALREAYFAGRLAELWELNRAAGAFRPTGLGPLDPRAFESLGEALLDRRNEAWVPVIEDSAARHPRLLVAAGASHLPGESGLLSLLEARGWMVEPLGPGACCAGFWEPPAEP